MNATTGVPLPRPDAHPPGLAPVVLVLGKGGVGRTTMAAGLALLEARLRGSSVLVEFGDGASGRRALGSHAGQVEHVVIKPDEALRRGATPLFRSAALARLVMGNFAMKPLTRAAPSIRELAMLESIRQISAERPGVRVMVDMPATGHSVAWLRVPRLGARYLRSGPLFEFCARLMQELVAPGKASVIVVTLPERLVLEETLELCLAIVNETGFNVDRLIVNRVPLALSHAALQDATRLAGEPGPVGHAAGQLASLLEARENASREALAALSTVSHARFALWKIPQVPVEPCSADVACWLAAEGAG